MNINSIFNQFGSSVYLSDKEGWKSCSFRAFLQPLRYKTKLYMEGERTPIGVNRNDVYLYLGPANHDLTRLDDKYRIHDIENNIYMIDRAEKIKVQDKTVYIWAVIRKTTEVNL